jgi:DNA-binding SARP family transcriptional activator/Tfp pilus assembly protein PilF
MTRDEVVELFWPDSDTDAAASNLRSTLYAMRRALENGRASRAPDVIFGDHSSVWLGPEAELWMDAVVFEQKVAEAWRSPDPLPLLEESSALYAGDFLPDDLYEDWAGERREALKRTWTELQFGLAQALEARSSDVNAALQPLERLLRADPCDERAAQEQMKLLTRYGRRAEALRVYQRLQQSLRDELGVEPSPDTTELQRQIGAGEAVASPPIPGAAFRCTYPFPVPSELVGRDDELGLLSQVLSSGRTAGRLALVGAPAGTGKSALLGQIVRQAQAQGVLCLAGGCYEERGAVPLGPFHDALVDFLLAQAPETIRAQMAVFVDDLAEVIPELRYHVQLTADPGPARGPRDRMRAFGAVHACLRSLAESGPVLLCLEDLHAADEATLQLLHYLARQTRRLPLVMVATYRDDERPVEPMAQTMATLMRERLAQSIKLSPLGPDDTHRMVVSLLDGSPSDALGESLYETTGGNPLFVEQLVLALEETGQLEQKAGVWHGTGELHGTPRIVREVIAQRLQQFDASSRELLDMASVLGQSFEHRVLLAAVASRDEASLLRDADRAITAQVLQDTPGGYAFRHALLRDAVYYDLSGPRRMLLHGHVAEVLEKVYGARADEHAAEIAYHFGLAGESSELRAKRLHYNLIAGRRAAQLSSYPQALDHFSRAWEIIQQDASFPDVELQVEVLQGRGWAETQMARWRDTVATYRQALGLLNDPIARSRAYGLIAFAFTHVGDLRQVREECSTGLAELVGQDGPEVVSARLQLQQVLAGTLHWQGHYRELVQLGQAMQAEAAHIEQSRPQMLANVVTAWGYWGMGQIQRASDHIRRAIQSSEQMGEKLGIATNYENLGLIEQAGGQFAAAREHLEHALELFGQSANELRAVNSLQTLCRVWVAQGEAARARGQLMRVLPLEVAGSERWAADGYCILAHIQSLCGEWDDAAENFQQAMQMRQGAGHRAGAVEATVGLGMVYQQTGRRAEAAATFDSAVRITSQMDTSPPQVMVQRHKGLLRLLAGDVEGAAIAIEDAYVLAREMPESQELSPSILALARLRARQGACRDAIELTMEALAEARPVQQSVDAHTLLAELCLDTGEPNLAREHADEAVARAELLGSPWLLSRALVCQARTSSPSDAAAANELFERAIKLADQARSPHERAKALNAYAAHLRLSNQLGPTLMWAEVEAQRILAELDQGWIPGPL